MVIGVFGVRGVRVTDLVGLERGHVTVLVTPPLLSSVEGSVMERKKKQLPATYIPANVSSENQIIFYVKVEMYTKMQMFNREYWISYI